MMYLMLYNDHIITYDISLNLYLYIIAILRQKKNNFFLNSKMHFIKYNNNIKKES